MRRQRNIPYGDVESAYAREGGLFFVAEALSVIFALQCVNSVHVFQEMISHVSGLSLSFVLQRCKNQKLDIISG